MLEKHCSNSILMPKTLPESVSVSVKVHSSTILTQKNRTTSYIFATKVTEKNK